MPRPHSRPAPPTVSPPDVPGAGGVGPFTTPLTADLASRWADRIADGRDEFPAGLAEPDRSTLAAAVRWRLRDGLVRHIARAIAAEVAREGPHVTEDRTRVDT